MLSDVCVFFIFIFFPQIILFVRKHCPCQVLNQAGVVFVFALLLLSRAGLSSRSVIWCGLPAFGRVAV